MARLKLTKLRNSEIYALVRIARGGSNTRSDGEMDGSNGWSNTRSDGVIDVVRHTKLTHVICIIRVLP